MGQIICYNIKNMRRRDPMDNEKLKNRIGSNIAMYRKRSGLTQAGLAEKLN